MSPEVLIGYIVHWTSVKSKNENISGKQLYSLNSLSITICVHRMHMYIHLEMSHIIMQGCWELVVFYLQCKPQYTKVQLCIFSSHYSPYTSMDICLFYIYFVCGSTYSARFLFVLVFCSLGFVFVHVLEDAMDTTVFPL